MPRILKGNFETKRAVKAPEEDERTLEEQFERAAHGLPDSAPSSVFAPKSQPLRERAPAPDKKVIRVIGVV